jgi:CubicO group peptidase (beta-lactamase class C family)
MIPSTRTFRAALACTLVACTVAPPPATPPASRTGSAGPSSPPVEQAFAVVEPQYAFADRERRKKLESAFPEIDAILDGEMRKQNIPGLVVGVVIDGDLAHARGWGVTDLGKGKPPDADTVYRIGSITKSFTGLAILSLRDKGALALDDPLTRLLPEAARLVYPTRDARPITLRQLATHTSGLPLNGGYDYTNPKHVVTEAEVTKSLSGLALDNAPGATQAYSNLGFALLAIAAGRARRSSYREVVRTQILAPLGMTSTFWDSTDVPAGRLATPYARTQGGESRAVEPWRFGAAEGGGGLYASLRDMARYAAFVLAAHPPRNAPDEGPIQRSTVREAYSSGLDSGLRVRLEDTPRKGESLLDVAVNHYGFGWVAARTCDFDDLVWHDGATEGFSADIHLLPKRGVAVILLSNLYLWDRAPHETVIKILRALARTGGLIARTPPLSPEFAVAMKRFLGVYNSWDDTAYAAMQSKHREKTPSEREEFADYKKLHGVCKGYEPIEVEGPRGARFKMDCERGTLEMAVYLGADGLIVGFNGTSRDLPIEPRLRKTVDEVSALIGKWDAATYKKHLAAKARTTRDEAAREFDALRWRHGACTAKSATRRWTGAEYDRTFDLVCQRGGALSLILKTDAKDPNAVTAYSFASTVNATCPVR